MLESFRQNQLEQVALNEPLVLHFSEELDARSVTHASARIVDPLGTRVEGRFEPVGNRLTFRPRLPRSSVLVDGSFRPGTWYTLELAGFPRPDGLRAESGAVLAASLRASFRTVALGGDAPLFVDPSPERVLPFELVSPQLFPGKGLVLECGQGLDPTTIEQSLDPGDVAEWAFDLRGGDGKPIPLRTVLLENQSEYARLQLLPVDRLNPRMARTLEPGTYGLFWKAVERGPATLGGLRVPASWPNAARIDVVAPAAVRLVESFDDVARRSFEMLASVDGQALWEGDGAVRVRYPRAAGDGRDGAKRLAGKIPLQRLLATKIEVREGTEAVLPADGLVVLAAQRSIDIDGRLVRRVERGDAGRRDGESHAHWRRRVERPDTEWTVPTMFDLGSSPGGVPPTLSEFLEAAAVADEAWTVIVTGGDLRVTGTIDVDGPLLIVTGGWLRALGRIEARRVWVLPGNSGGGDVRPGISGVAPLTLDVLEPGDPNPLATRLRVGVLSRRLPIADVVYWRDPVVVSEPPLSPLVRVRIFGVDPDTGVEFGPVLDPALLMRLEAIRFLVELETPPADVAPVWDPPRLDRIEFAWTSGTPLIR